MALEELNDSTTLSRFDGSNPVRWLFEVERFFCLYKIYEEERFPYVVAYFDDEPFYWFNSWYRGHEHLTWKSFAIAMLRRFTTTTAAVTKNTDTPPPPQPTRQTYTTNLPEPKHKVTPPPKPQPLIALFSPTSPITTSPSCTKPVTPPSTTVPKLTHNAAVRLQWRPPWQPVTYGIWSISKSSKQRFMERMHKNLTIPFFLTMEYGRISGEEDATLLSSSAPGPYATIRREWRPPWCYVETLPNIVVQLEWQPPWQPASRYVETDPNVMVRLEWRPPWIGSPSLRTRTFFRAGVLIRSTNWIVTVL